MEPVVLTSKQRRVADLYYVQGLTQCEVARRLRRKRTAITMMLLRVRAAYAAAGIALQRPGAGLTSITPLSLSGAWDRCEREYVPRAEAV